MKGGKPVFVVFVLCFVIVFFYQRDFSHKPANPLEPPHDEAIQAPSGDAVQSIPRRSLRIRRSQFKPSQVRSATNHSASEQKALRDQGIVEVEIVNGYAINQGDILLGKANEGISSTRGQAQVQEVRFWTSPEIPYAINSNIPNTQKLKIESALAYLREKTPVHFIPYEGQGDAIIFEAGSEHCISILGKVGGLQPIRLDSECGTQEVLHEVMHALGFPHEQSRNDRDQFVEILWANIEEKYQDQFMILPDLWMTALRDSRFDLESIMMYRNGLFANTKGLPTLRALQQQPIEPVSQGLSIEDIARLKRLFYMAP